MNEIECDKAGEVTVRKDVGIGSFKQFKPDPANRPTDTTYKCVRRHIKRRKRGFEYVIKNGQYHVLFFS